jgi:lipoic acid synthetase
MRKPDWLRTRLPSGPEFDRVNRELQARGINTVCSSARCPNLAECWGKGTTTFMILGDTCTRHCRFCSVATGNPHGARDASEPKRVAEAVAELGIMYVVLTSVDRDDLPDFGAGAFADTVRQVKGLNPKSPSVLVEVLTPDFGGREELIRLVVEAGPSVFGHNLETVERLTPAVRDRRASYRRSLEVLATVKRLSQAMTTKSGLMVGLGETDGELRQALADLRSVGCDIVTVGQYLQPARHCLPVQRYLTPDRFVSLEQEARALGFKNALCGPLVRSSYHAQEVAQ